MQRRSVTEWLSLGASGIVSGGAFMANLCLIAMLLIIFVNVILRYVILRPLYWGDEIMTNLMIIMVYAGFGFMLTKGAHVRMTLLFNKLPGQVQNLLWIVICLIGTGYTIFLLYAVIVLLLDTIRIGSFSLITRWPIAPWQILIALGLFSLLLAFLMVLIERVDIARGIRKEKEVKKEVVEVGE
jgi:C4-dicarboxylate transporter DctQ subunit